MNEELTTIERLIIQAVNAKLDTWLNCHGNYVGEALALQAKGLITTRVVDGQMQVQAVTKCELCGETVSGVRFCDKCFALPNNEFYGEFAARHMGLSPC